MKSKFLTLNRRDFMKGLVLAVLVAAGTALTDALQSGDTSGMLKKVGIASAVAFISYLMKNLLTNNKDELLTSDKK